MLPLSFILAVIFISEGVVQNYHANFSVLTLENKFQSIATGPVAALESIKHLGTNGGGFFGANSSMPFENPTLLTNFLQILSMMLIPSACVVAFGLMVYHRKERQGFALMGKEGGVIFGAMGIIFIISLLLIYFSEKMSNPNLDFLGLNPNLGNLEGKEIRFGTDGSSLFSAVTTAFTTGSVNNMHDSLNPLSISATLLNMMLNIAFGGEGVGLMNMIIYVLLTVFICALMIGRTPEFLGKKIESAQMKLIALVILIHPLLILVLSALAVVFAKDSISNPSFHGLAQILYEFSSSAANNGSGLEGLKDDNLFWNLSTAFAMFCGRYLVLIAQLAIAGSLLAKNTQENTANSLKTDNLTFMFVLVCIIYIFAALTFFPVLTLSSVAEYLSLWHQGESMSKKQNKLITKEILNNAIKGAFLKFDPRFMVKNPVMFMVEVGSILTLILSIFPTLFNGNSDERIYNILITFILFVTLLFANFAESIAEGRGKAQAAP